MSNVISNYVTAHDYKVHYPNTQKALNNILYHCAMYNYPGEGGGHTRVHAYTLTNIAHVHALKLL